MDKTETWQVGGKTVDGFVLKFQISSTSVASPSFMRWWHTARASSAGTASSWLVFWFRTTQCVSRQCWTMTSSPPCSRCWRQRATPLFSTRLFRPFLVSETFCVCCLETLWQYFMGVCADVSLYSVCVCVCVLHSYAWTHVDVYIMC